MLDEALFDEIMLDDPSTSGVPDLPQFPEVNLAFPILTRPIFETLDIPYVNGSEQRLIHTDEPKREIILKLKNATKDDRDLIYNFFLARKGRTETFYWIDPTTELIYVIRFKEDNLNIEYFAYKLYHLDEIDLIETYWSEE